MRLIDADAIGLNDFEILMCDGSYKEALKMLLNKIEAAPTVEERKTGKWVRVPGYCTPGGDPVWACSECGKGEHVFGIEHGSYGARIADDQWVSCPNCGALMEGEE